MAFDFAKLFIPTQSVLELIVRGAFVYTGLLILFRLILKRQTGGLNVSDLLLMVLVADAVQNGMAGESTTITEALILGATLMACSYFVDWASYRFARVDRFFNPDPNLVVFDGRMIHRNMQRELLTRDELMAQLRLQGVDKISDVKRAIVETDGKLSVITHSKKEPRNPAVHGDFAAS